VPRFIAVREGTDLLRIAARAVYPVSGPVVVDGAVLVQGDGRIAQVGPDREVPRPEGAEIVELADDLVMPGLVNLHTHLELTALGGSIEDDDFFAWILHLRGAKDAMSVEAFRLSAEQGVRDAWTWGTTTVADTGDSGMVVDALTSLGGRGVFYQEVFGPHPDQAADALAGLERVYDELVQRAGETVAVGVSPHAPYTVSRTLYRLVAERAAEAGIPVAVHIAESQAEADLVARGTGPFAAAWQLRGIPPIQRARSPVALLEETRVLHEGLLAIHAVRADAPDVELLRDRGCCVALCPVSNERHGHGAPPIAAFREAGLVLGIGTDSVASVGSLDLFREMRAVRDHGGLTAEEAIEVGTLGGARALGMDSEIGSLEEGKWADLSVLSCPPDTGLDGAGLARRILDTRAGDVVRTYVGGRCVYDARQTKAPFSNS
jgi:5-methylthioadenosine/S-adenosylhomocysteine deaminase